MHFSLMFFQCQFQSNIVVLLTADLSVERSYRIKFYDRIKWSARSGLTMLELRMKENIKYFCVVPLLFSPLLSSPLLCLRRMNVIIMMSNLIAAGIDHLAQTIRI